MESTPGVVYEIGLVSETLATTGIPWVGFRKEGLVRAEFRE